MNNELNLDLHQLVYVPHVALETPTSSFDSVEPEYRMMISQHMKKIMEQHRGIGLSANQINLDVAVLVQMIDQDAIAMFNPEILEISDYKVLMTEGCLSDPGLYLKISRPTQVKVRWEDESGELDEAVLNGLNARVFLHEYDHLQGILFTDRVGRVKLDNARKKQIKLINRATKHIINSIR